LGLDDKYALLVSIANGRVSRLQLLVAEVAREAAEFELQLCEFTLRIADEYADAQDAHQVLTEDVKFLELDDQKRLLNKKREMVAGFARAVGALRPDLAQATLSKPLTMLLLGMVNWMFMRMKPGGKLDHAALEDRVADPMMVPAMFSPPERRMPCKPAVQPGTISFRSVPISPKTPGCIRAALVCRFGHPFFSPPKRRQA
jgi:hypothetical protein